MKICQKCLFEKGLDSVQHFEVKGMRVVYRPKLPAEIEYLTSLGNTQLS